ncbi:MAG TPA: sulfite exporter TauE/SafE family protein [Stellaceae bacterium]|nr:sulfite exporter TauE/SafE family protein [Stellaceae bacterium]
MPNASVAELVWLLLAVIAAGVVTGLLAGVFGIGGGAVIVPVLFELFRLFGVPEVVRIQLCIGTSLAIIVPTAIRSYRAHRARGLVIPEVVRIWTVPAVLGVAVGAAIAAVAPEAVFKVAFVVIVWIIAARLVAGGERWRVSDSLPRPAVMRSYGFVIGLGSSLMGISGGSLATMALTVHGQPILAAVATSAGIGVPIAIIGAIGYALAGLPHQSLMPPLSLGFVSAVGVVAIAPISSWVAPLGARLAHALPKRWLELGFAAFLFLVGARFLLSLVG